MKKKGLLFVLLFTLSVFLLSACDKDDYQKAVKAGESGDFETAIELFTKLSKKNYEDSASQLEKTKIRQMISRVDSGDWENADCSAFWGRDDIAQSISGIPDMTNLCFYQKARYLQEHGRYEEALDALRQTRGKSPEGFDGDRMVFENEYALCRAEEDQNAEYQCLADLAPYGLQYRGAGAFSDYYREQKVFYEDEETGRLLFWRDELGESGPAEQLSFPEYMDRCLNNRGYWLCAKDFLFDMVYFAEKDQVRAYQDALAWAEQQENKEAAEWAKNMPKRCIGGSAPSAYTGTAYPIDVPAACEAEFRPELETWFRENLDISKPAEGFWNSDTFYETFGFDTEAPGFGGIGTIRNDFRAEDPYPKSVAIIVNSAAQYSRPKESWKDDPEMTDDIVRWVNDTAALYKAALPDWTFIDDPSRAAYILFFDMNWEQTGTFQGKAGDKNITVSVYNLRISGECWENRAEGRRNTIISRSTNLGQENTIPGVQKDLVAQHLVISSEAPLTFAGAVYDPAAGTAWSDKRPEGYSDSLVKWLKELESEQTDG